MLLNYFKTVRLRNERALARDGWRYLVFQKRLGKIKFILDKYFCFFVAEYYEKHRLNTLHGFLYVSVRNFKGYRSNIRVIHCEAETDCVFG